MGHWDRVGAGSWVRSNKTHVVLTSSMLAMLCRAGDAEGRSPERCWYVSRRSVLRIHILQLLGIGGNRLLTDSLRLFCLQTHTHVV